MSNDKKWFKQELNKIRSYRLSPMLPNQINKEEVLKLIEQLDEPKKVVVPQFVAEWIEKNHACYETLTMAFAQVNAMHSFGMYGTPESKIKIKKTQKWIKENELLFSRAWLEGCTAEDENLTLIIKSYDKTLHKQTITTKQADNIMEGLE